MKRINKQGFTLIEMLAVVVLLGLLIALLYPAITKYITQTRENTYTLYENNMEKAAKNMMSECVENNDLDCIPVNGTSKVYSLAELIAMGYSDKLADPKVEGEECDKFRSYVTVHNDNTSTVNLTYGVCLRCEGYDSGYCDEPTTDPPGGGAINCKEEDDHEAPQCGETTGESTIWTNKDKVITVMCSDDCTGCVQDVFSKKIDTDTKTTTIEIGDNSGKTKTCNVNAYVDKTPPTCSLEIVGVLGNNGWYKEDPAPIVKIKTKGDTLSGVSTYGIGTSKFIYDFNKETEYQVKEGITTVYGYVMDNAGNVGTCSIEVKYDSSIPAVKTVDYGYVIYPKEDIASVSGKTISLNNLTGEYGNIYGVYVYMTSGNGGKVTIKNNTTTLKTLTIPSDPGKAKIYFDEPSSFTKLRFVFESESQVSNIERIELLTRDGTAGYYTNKNVTLYIKSTDSVSGKAKYSFNGGLTLQDDNFKTYEKNTTVVTAVSDSSGNLSEPVTKVIDNIDKVRPECGITFTGQTHDNNYYWEDVPVTLSKDDSPATTDYAMSGTRKFGLVASAVLTYNDKATDTQTLDTTGTTWYGYVIDRAGNTKTCNALVKKDSQDPECNLKLNGTKGEREWYVSSTVEVVFDYYRDVNKDGSQSGRATWDITKSSTPSYNKNTSQTQSADTTSVTYYGYIKDNSGRTNSCSITFKKDSTKPTCEITAEGQTGLNNWFTGNVTLTLVRSDATSLVNSYDLKDTNTESYNNHATMTLSNDTTSQTYYGFVKDNAGNKQTCTKTVKRDTTPPTCSLELEGSTINVESWYTGDVKVKWKTRSDATSGIAGYQIDTSSGQPGSNPSNYDKVDFKTQTTDTTTSGVKYYGHVIDDAGLQNNCDISFKRDSVKPTCDFTIPTPGGDNSWHIANVKLDLTKSDALSGIHKYGINDYDSRVTVTQTSDTTGTTYTCKVMDKAGNEFSRSRTVKKDTVNPTCSITATSGTAGLNSWFRSNVTLGMTTSDDTSKIAYKHLSGTSGWPSSNANYNGSTSATESNNQARRYYYGYVKDNAGHTGSCNYYFGIDKVKPECGIRIGGNVGENGWFVGNVKVTLHTHTDALSGVQAFGIDSYNGDDDLNHTTDTTGVTYTGKVKDNAGNEETCSISFKRDTVAPTCGYEITTDRSTSGVSGKVKCTDNASGCVNSVMTFSNLKAPTTGNITGAPMQEYSDNINVENHGAYIIKDNAGHTNSCFVSVVSYCRFKSGQHSECGHTYWEQLKKCVYSIRGYHKWTRKCEKGVKSVTGTYHPSLPCTKASCGKPGCRCTNPTGTYNNGTVCTTRTCNKSGCSCDVSGEWTNTNIELDCTADQCGEESSCNCTYAWGFENYKDPTLYAECKGEVEFPCDQAHDAKSYLYCHKVGGYTINEPTVPTEVDTCVEQSIDSCGSDDDLGKIQRTCEPNENKTCRTKGNGCETFYFKFGSLTDSPGTNTGSEGGAGCGAGALLGNSGPCGTAGNQVCVIQC